MSNPFTRVYLKLRRVNTLQGDTPQRIAARELQDASRWPELVQINGLVPPYLTDDPAAVVPGVILTGRPIQVPDGGGAPSANAAPDPDTAFGTDLALVGGTLTDDGNGDFLTVSGVANLRQALKIRLDTPLRNLLYHLEYGNIAHAYKGMKQSPAHAMLVLAGVKRCVRSDDRISATKQFSASVVGDRLDVQGQAVTTNGVPVDVKN